MYVADALGASSWRAPPGVGTLRVAATSFYLIDLLHCSGGQVPLTGFVFANRLSNWSLFACACGGRVDTCLQPRLKVLLRLELAYKNAIINGVSEAVTTTDF